jgi:hypothetical protein
MSGVRTGAVTFPVWNPAGILVVVGKDLPWSALSGGLAVVPHRLRVVLLLALLLVAATWVQPAKSAAAGPVATINSGPEDPTPTNDPTPTFSFTSEPGAKFRCNFDGFGFSDCSSPLTLPRLPDGPHTLAVVASDALGNGPVASRAFTVDTVPPDGRITGGPVGPTSDPTPTFSFTSEPGARFKCNFDGFGFSDCSSPLTLPRLPDGPHTFTVEARDVAGNPDPSPASASFMVDTVPPQTIITSGPPASSTDSTPTFAFAATESGARFECSLDKGAFSRCTSALTLGPLSPGAHSFAVRARDAAGNIDASPATLTFTILSPPVNRGPDPVAVIATAFAQDLNNAVGQLRTSELPTLARARGITVRGIDPLVPGTARMTVTARSGHPARRVGVLRGAKAFATARKGSLRLKPTRAGRRLLPRARRLRLTVSYVFTARIGIRMSAAQQVTVWRRWLTLSEVARVARHWIYRYFGERARSLTLARCTRRSPTFVRCSDVRWLNRGRWWHVRLRVRETATGFRQRMSDARSG